MQITKSSINEAMKLLGFENWRPKADVPELHRPWRRPVELPGNGRSAAVMVLIYPDQDTRGRRELRLVLTRRHEKLTEHAGQISLPGGRQNDRETLENAALRETSEEIGVAVERIEILGQLNPVYIPPSDFTVAPFVGWLDAKPKFIRSEAEVAEIIEVPLEHLLNPETMVHGEVKMGTGSMQVVPYYQVDRHRVWGATAIILGEFVERVGRVARS